MPLNLTKDEHSRIATGVETGWLPIKGAPKTGLKVLIWDGKAIYAAWWDNKFEFTCGPRGGMKYTGAWTDGAVASFGYEETRSYEPTHWRPLPLPPTNPRA